MRPAGAVGQEQHTERPSVSFAWAQASAALDGWRWRWYRRMRLRGAGAANAQRTAADLHVEEDDRLSHLLREGKEEARRITTGWIFDDALPKKY